MVSIQQEERIIHGEILNNPICSFSSLHEGGTSMGWVYKIKTSQFVDYDIKDVEIWISSVYDITKWNIIKKGEKVSLSVIQKQNSKFAEEGVALKCNIVSRTF
jgi:hypothetical protein